MDAHARNLMEQALDAYRTRVLRALDQYAEATGLHTLDDLDPIWEEITRNEAVLLSEQGPDDYPPPEETGA